MRKILLLAVMLVVWFLPGIPVSADTQEEILAQSGADSIAVDEQTNSFLEDHAISFTDPQSALTLSPKELLCSMWNTFRAQLAAPLRLFFTLGLVVICSAFTSGLGDTISDRGLSGAYGFLVVMVAVSVLLTPMEQCFSIVSDTMESGSRFMLSFAPVLSSILAAGGGVVSASVYQLAVFSLAELAVQLTCMYLMPLLRILLALGIMDSVHPDFPLAASSEGSNGWHSGGLDWSWRCLWACKRYRVWFPPPLIQLPPKPPNSCFPAVCRWWEVQFRMHTPPCVAAWGFCAAVWEALGFLPLVPWYCPPSCCWGCIVWLYWRQALWRSWQGFAL